MRKALLILLATVILLTVLPAAVLAGEQWRPGLRRATAYADGRAGSVRFAIVAPDGAMYRHRAVGTVPAASVVKVMFMVAYLRQSSVRDRPLRDADKDLLRPMIRRSDNDTATQIANLLGPQPIERLAKDAGMRHFSYTRPWGLSRINARDQARFMFRLERYIPARHEGYARYLLSHILESQSWGVGSLHHPNWTFYFKGGWGSGTGWVGHQVAFLERGDLRIAIAVLTESSPSHRYATETVRGVADRLLQDLPRE